MFLTRRRSLALSMFRTIFCRPKLRVSVIGSKSRKYRFIMRGFFVHIFCRGFCFFNTLVCLFALFQNYLIASLEVFLRFIKQTKPTVFLDILNAAFQTLYSLHPVHGLLSENPSVSAVALAGDVYFDFSRTKAISGDALNIAELKSALDGIDVVYCAISGEKLPKIAENIVSAMTEKGVKRLIFMGAVGIYNEIPDDIDGEDNLDNEPEQIPNRKAVDIVEASGLNYTVLRPGYLGEGDEDDFVLTFKGEHAKGYTTTIPSLVKLAVKLISDDALYPVRASASRIMRFGGAFEPLVLFYVFLCDIGDKIVPISSVLRLVALGADKLPDILVFGYVVSNVIANAAVALGVKIEQCFHFGLAQLQSVV